MLTFDELSTANRARMPVFGHTVEDWSPAEWACCVAGEVGELCDKIKKRYIRNNQGSVKVSEWDIAEELADVVIYADLLAQRMGIDLEMAVRTKFNQLSKQKDSVVRL